MIGFTLGLVSAVVAFGVIPELRIRLAERLERVREDLRFKNSMNTIVGEVSYLIDEGINTFKESSDKATGTYQAGKRATRRFKESLDEREEAG